MTNVIDFTKYHDSIRWTLANGWNIYIWNRMLQDQERAIQNEERKLLSTKPGAPKLNPANIGMPIDPEPDHVDDAFIYTTDQAREIADRLTERLHEKHPPEQVQFLSTPLGDNYFYDHYIQRLNQEEDRVRHDPKPWIPKAKGRLLIDGKDAGEVTDFQFGVGDNITNYHGLPEIPVGDDSWHKETGLGKAGCPQHNSKESSQQENSCRIQDTTGEEN